MNYHLISAIIKGVWAINQDTALGYAPLIKNILGESPVAFEFDQEQFKPFSIDRTTINARSYTRFNDAPKGSIAVIPLSGPLMKNDQYCGPVGMETIGNIIKEADASQNIDGIILKIDSPGGTVDGTVQLADIVENTQKPIIAFADGLMASAALWIGASTDSIIAATNKTTVGSIGVFVNFTDLQPAYEMLGVKFHIITADQSSDKTKIWKDIRAGKYEDFKKETLNPLTDDFIAQIQSHRPHVKKEQLTGKVYFAEDVMGELVDDIGNFDYAVNILSQMIDEMKINSSSNNKNAEMKTFLAINTLLGVELQSNKEGVYLNEQQLEQINTAIESGNANAQALADANTAKEKAETERDANIESLATAKSEIETQKKEIEALKGKPGDKTATAVVEIDRKVDAEKDENVTKDSKSFVENLDAIAEEFLS